jgi:hypothetical protein
MLFRILVLVSCLLVSTAGAQPFPSSLEDLLGNGTPNIQVMKKCCKCCYTGFVPTGKERQCFMTSSESKCVLAGWGCTEYIFCPK